MSAFSYMKREVTDCCLILASPFVTRDISWSGTAITPPATTTTTAASNSLTESTSTSATAAYSTTELALSVVTAISLVACIGLTALLCWCKRLRGVCIFKKCLSLEIKLKF